MTLRIDEEDNIFGAHITMKGFLPDDDPMVIFSKEIYPMFNDKDFEDIYSKLGREAKSPSFLTMVTLLQYRENMSDEEATEACIKRIDWKIALHLSFDAKKQFDSSTLCRFRKRLKENDKSSIAFDKILEGIKNKGFIKKNTNQRIDATHIVSHVNRISTTDLLFRAVKCAVEEIRKLQVSFYEEFIPEDIKERYEGKFSSFGMSKEKRTDKMAEIIEDGLYLKKILTEYKIIDISEFQQLAIMETIFEENVVITKKEINSTIFIDVEEIQSPKQTIFDPRDTSLKMGVKGKTSWVGSKCHIVETAVKGKRNFITGMIYQKSNVSDQRIHYQYIEVNNKSKLQPEKIFADQNYISGESIFNYQKNNQELLGIIGSDNSKKVAEFKLSKFEIDMKALTAVCPMEKKSEKYSTMKDGSYNIYFAYNDCVKCDHKLECAQTGKDKKRRLHVNQYYEQIRERRLLQETESFRKSMSVRAQVEGTISEAVRELGLRFAKYHGEKGHQFQFYMTGAALNVKRLIKAMSKGMNMSPAM